MRQLFQLLNLTLGLIIINAGVVIADSSGGFNLRAGVGYDFISQEYFLESDSILIGPDSSLKSALLKKDYMDDKKGFLNIGYTNDPENDKKFIQNYEIGWEQTDELIRILGFGRLSQKWKKSRLEGDFRLELKENYKRTAEPGEELMILNGQLDYKIQLSNKIDLRSRIYGESVNFDTVVTFIYNYSRSGIELGFNLFTENFNSLFVNSALEIRDVPDSNQLDYNLFRGNIGYFGTFVGTYLTADLGFEARDYNHPDGRDDYFSVSVNGDIKKILGESFFLRARQNLEYFDFRQNDFINDDYYLVRLALLGGRNFGEFEAFSAFLGPEIELLNIDSDYTNENDYTEIMAVCGLDYFGSDKLFFMIENKFGKRIYKYDSIYRSKFLFDRANLIGSVKLIGELNFDILLSFDLEFHDVENENSRLYLISGNLSYRF